MRIEERFTVDAPADRVWAFLKQPARVAEVLPGAEIDEQIDEKTYSGGMAMKVGPLAVAYTGTVSFDLDEEERSAAVHAQGRGKAGMGTASMRMTSRVSALTASETAVDVDADVTVTGIVAQLSRGMIQVVSKKMFADFAANLSTALATSDQEEDGP